MSVIPGRIATATGPISHERNGVRLSFNRGDVIHDEEVVQHLFAAHFHGVLTPHDHSPHHCPAECAKAFVPAQTARAASPAMPLPPAPAPTTEAAK